MANTRKVRVPIHLTVYLDLLLRDDGTRVFEDEPLSPRDEHGPFCSTCGVCCGCWYTAGGDSNLPCLKPLTTEGTHTWER